MPRNKHKHNTNFTKWRLWLLNWYRKSLHMRKVTVSRMRREICADGTFGITYVRNENLNDLYCSQNIFRMIKWRGMRWAGHIARMGERRGVYRVFGGEIWGKEITWGDPGVDERIILRWIFRKWDVGVWTGLDWLRIGTVGGHLWTGWWNFGLHKMLGISWLAGNRLASQEGLCSVEWVSEWVSRDTNKD